MPAAPADFSSPFDDLIGTEWIDDDPDGARVRLQVRDDLRQPVAILHGGVISTLIESVCSRATHHCAAREGLYATGQSIEVSFLRPVRDGTIDVSARALHRGRTSWVWQAEVKDSSGRLCAVGKMTVAVRPARNRGSDALGPRS
jgi:1,4-dihydroxy-2-naphthoyl-CoA hydrolase